MSTKRTEVLIIENMSAERLNRLMVEYRSYICYDSNLANEFLSSFDTSNMSIDQIIDLFTDYILSQGLEEEVVL